MRNRLLPLSSQALSATRAYLRGELSGRTLRGIRDTLALPDALDSLRMLK
jgi:hypothetical protein